MKESRFEVKFLIFLCLIIFSSSSLISQVTDYKGVLIPEGYKVIPENSEEHFSKANIDTVDYKTLEKLKQDFVINKGCGDYGADQQNINIAKGGSGYFLTVWNDSRTGDKQVDGQLFDESGNKVGPVFHVSEGNAYWNSAPDVVYNPITEEYVVSWAGTGYDIFFQRISFNGNKIGGNVRANNMFISNTNNPSTAIDSSGNIIITWISGWASSSLPDPYCRIFDSSGNPITDQWLLYGSETHHAFSAGFQRRIASDSLGRCFIVWSTHIDGLSRIVLQSVDQSGNLFDNPISVSDPTDSNRYYFPTITSTSDGHFFIAWDSEKGSFKGRIFSADSGLVTDQFDLGSGYGSVGLSSDNNKFYLVVEGPGLLGSIVSKEGTFITSKKDIGTVLSGYYLSRPKLAILNSNKIFVTGSYYDRSQTDIILTSYDLQFDWTGTIIKAADDSCSARQTKPLVKYNQYGNALIIWEDERNGYNDLYGQILDVNEMPVSGNFKINNIEGNNFSSDPKIAVTSNGEFIAVFSSGDYSNKKIYAQKIAPDGTFIGSNRMVIDYSYITHQTSIEINDKDEILLAFNYPYSSDVYYRLFNSDLKPLSETNKFFEISNDRRVYATDMNKHFNTLVVWSDYDSQSHTAGNYLYASIKDISGNFIQPLTTVCTTNDNQDIYNVECVIDESNNLIFVWKEYDRDRWQYSMKIKRYYFNNQSSATRAYICTSYESIPQIVRFSNRKAIVAWSDGYDVKSAFIDDAKLSIVPVKLHYFNSNNRTVIGLQNNFSIDIFNDRLLFSYESSKIRDVGYEIYANVQILDTFNFEDEKSVIENILSIYPNPAPHSAILKYVINNPTNVSVSLYNVLGQKIDHIDCGLEMPGEHTVQFNTEKLTSGVYFMHYVGAGSFIKKFMVLK